MWTTNNPCNICPSPSHLPHNLFRLMVGALHLYLSLCHSDPSLTPQSASPNVTAWKPSGTGQAKVSLYPNPRIQAYHEHLGWRTEGCVSIFQSDSLGRCTANLYRPQTKRLADPWTTCLWRWGHTILQEPMPILSLSLLMMYHLHYNMYLFVCC